VWCCAGRLFKVTIPTSGAPVVTEVEIFGRDGARVGVTGADGLIWHPNGNLIISAESWIFSLSSRDGWQHAYIRDQQAPAMTGVATCTVHAGSVWAVHGHLGQMGSYAGTCDVRVH
jgi:hypothetical protein